MKPPIVSGFPYDEFEKLSRSAGGGKAFQTVMTCTLGAMAVGTLADVVLRIFDRLYHKGHEQGHGR